MGGFGLFLFPSHSCYGPLKQRRRFLEYRAAPKRVNSLQEALLLELTCLWPSLCQTTVTNLGQEDASQRARLWLTEG